MKLEPLLRERAVSKQRRWWRIAAVGGTCSFGLVALAAISGSRVHALDGNPEPPLLLPAAAAIPSHTIGHADIAALAVVLMCVGALWSASVSRNVDELSGSPSGTALTGVLTVATRSAHLGPMMYVLFLSTRTDGSGLEPVSSFLSMCMVVAAVGLCTQFVLVAFLYHSVKHIADMDFKEAAGDWTQMHPAISLPHGSKPAPFLTCILGVQGASVVAIYVGLGGVVFQALTRESSAFPIYTACLGIVFSVVEFCGWLMRELLDEKAAPKMRCAMGAASVEMKRAPMLVGMFAAARFIPPEAQLPGDTAGTYYVIAVCAFVAQTFVAAFRGFVGHEVKLHAGYRAYTASPLLNVAHQLFALVVFASVVLLTVECWAHMFEACSLVMCLGLIYFTVQTSHDLALLLGQTGLVRDTATTAVFCMNFVPLISVFFLAAQLHALQLTDFRGDLPDGVLKGMFCCVCATVVQLACCLATSILTGTVAVPDDDGNSTYDAKALGGMFVVFFVRYVNVLCLNGGVMVIVAALFSETPVTYGHASPPALLPTLLMSLAMLVLVPLLAGGRVIGMAMKVSLESVDQTLLGVDISVGVSAINLCRGRVHITNAIVSNPLGHKWGSEYLLKIEQLILKLDTWLFLKSCGAQAKLDIVVLHGVNINLEGLHKDGNVGILQARLENLVHASDLDDPNIMEAAKNLQEPELMIEGLSIKNINLCLVISGRHGPVLASPDLEYPNFSETCMRNGWPTLTFWVALILKTLIKTVFKNSANLAYLLEAEAGKLEGEAAHEMHQAGHAIHAEVGRLRQAASGLGHKLFG